MLPGAFLEPGPLSILLSLLCLGHEWRGKPTQSQPADERAPIHHSMTWSARRRRDGGMVNPSALAV